jgi:thiamine-phosphate pyrophosphorylase
MEMKTSPKITGGVYLVLNPAMELNLLLQKLADALKGGIQVVQIWNNWPAGADKLSWIAHIAGLCRFHRVPLLINEEWQLLQTSPFLEGVHFDNIPHDFDAIKASIGKPFMAGITCSGNLDDIAWADEHGLDYVSFCAMFPSASAGSCTIVMPATVRQAKKMTTIPIFVSGGITPENMITLKKQTPFDGVAVISGLLSAENPEQKVKEYHQALNSKIEQHETENH